MLRAAGNPAGSRCHMLQVAQGGKALSCASHVSLLFHVTSSGLVMTALHLGVRWLI